MKYNEWFKIHGHFDKIVRGLLPPAEELEMMTVKAVKEKFAQKIIRAAQDVDLELAENDLDAILERLVGLKEWPEFHISHYNLHC